jgi:transcriptional regulator with PAS, ATPase and Fis domain
VRIIAATNKDLDLLIRENKFRDDLYYRLNVLSLELPPLRTRTTDIRLYANTFLQECSTGLSRKFSLSRDAMQCLEEYPWPGNIRELKNLIQRLAVTTKTAVIDRALLTPILKHNKTGSPTVPSRDSRLIQEIKTALAETKGNYSAAAKLLGIHRMTLRRRMQKLGIEY